MCPSLDDGWTNCDINTDTDTHRHTHIIQAWRIGCFLSCEMWVIENESKAGQWWWTPLIPALGRQRQEDFWVQGQPGLQSEFQDSQGYTEKLCLEKTQKQKNKNQQQKSNLPLNSVFKFLTYLKIFEGNAKKAPCLPGGCVAWCSCGTPNSGNWGCLSLFFLFWDTFLPTGLSHPALIWGFVPNFTVSC